MPPRTAALLGVLEVLIVATAVFNVSTTRSQALERALLGAGKLSQALANASSMLSEKAKERENAISM